MLRVALTGGIASGKSLAAMMFRALGVPVIDSDEIARRQVEPGTPGLAQLAQAFGAGILDYSGRLDRAALREIIFADPLARERVNAILHPAIFAEIERMLGEVHAPYAVVEIPLLAETGLAGNFDHVLVIDAADDVRIARLRARDAVTDAQARAALAAQAPREERLRLASDVIDNNGDRDALRAAVEQLHARYLAESKRIATAPRRPAE